MDEFENIDLDEGERVAFKVHDSVDTCYVVKMEKPEQLPELRFYITARKGREQRDIIFDSAALTELRLLIDEVTAQYALDQLKLIQ